MTAPEPTRPADEHTDAVAEAMHASAAPTLQGLARAILTSTDPAVHLAMLAALVRAGVLTVDLMTLSDGYAGRLVTEWGAADLGGNAWAVAP